MSIDQKANIVFTDNAARKVYELITEEGNPTLKLRVYIIGGGCSGFQYGFAFEEVIKEGDFIVKKVAGDNTEEDEGGGGDGIVQLLIDPISYQYLMGAEIDYQEDLQGEQFIIRNPNAKTTCGCGSSFSI